MKQNLSQSSKHIPFYKHLFRQSQENKIINPNISINDKISNSIISIRKEKLIHNLYLEISKGKLSAFRYIYSYGNIYYQTYQ